MNENRLFSATDTRAQKHENEKDADISDDVLSPGMVAEALKLGGKIRNKPNLIGDEFDEIIYSQLNVPSENQGQCKELTVSDQETNQIILAESTQAQPLELETSPVGLPPDLSQPPYNREAEDAVIGSILINPTCYAEIVTILEPTDFFIQKNSWVFEACGYLNGRREPLDPLTISGELARMGKLEEIGGQAYLTSLYNAVPSTLNANTYARKVKEAKTRRELIAAASEIASLAYNPHVTVEQVSASALEAIQKRAGNLWQRYEIYTGADALEPQPPTEWVVKNLIQANSVNMIYGNPGSKKTWTGLHLAACVSRGENWLNYSTVKGSVLFVDEESGQKRLKDRLSRVLRGTSSTGENIYCISFAGFSLENVKDKLTLENLIKNANVKLVIFDALADLMDGDENSKQDVQPIFASLRKMSDTTGAAIVLIHHSGKNGDYRGSSAIKGAVDLMLEIKSQDDSEVVCFTTTKNRDGDKVKFAASAAWGVDVFTLLPSKVPGRTNSKAEDFVMQFFETHPGATVKECQDTADVCSPNVARKALYTLASRGLLHRKNPNEKVARYTINVSPVTDV